MKMRKQRRERIIKELLNENEAMEARKNKNERWIS